MYKTIGRINRKTICHRTFLHGVRYSNMMYDKRFAYALFFALLIRKGVLGLKNLHSFQKSTRILKKYLLYERYFSPLKVESASKADLSTRLSHSEESQ